MSKLCNETPEEQIKSLKAFIIVILVLMAIALGIIIYGIIKGEGVNISVSTSLCAITCILCSLSIRVKKLQASMYSESENKEE